MKKLYPILLIFACICLGCKGKLVDPDPANTPESNFQILWQEFDKLYAFFEYKNIDWDSVYTVYHPQVTPQTSDRQLFSTLSSMLSILKDGHVTLDTPFGFYNYQDWWKTHPVNYKQSLIENGYLKNGFEVVGGGNIMFGRLNSELGYIHISKFWGEKDWVFDFDIALESLRNCKGLVVDVRGNGGGQTKDSDYIASRFVPKKTLYAYVKWRNGPNHNDFTAPEALYVEPADKWQYQNPVVLLTNRQCFSTTEAFILSMRILPNVTVVGDTTGGGSGNPIRRELPNGWIYQVPRWILFTPDMKPFEGIGLIPDISVNMKAEDFISGKDTILETAMSLLK